MTITFAPMTPAQEQVYLPLVRAEYAAELRASGSFDEDRAEAKASASYASLHEDGEIYLAAYDGDQWVGVLGYVLKGFDDDPTTEPALYVYDLDVLEAYRRRGYGRAILDHAAAIARASGARSVLLTVWEGNDAARRLYEDRGFRYEAHQMRLAVESAEG